MSAEKHNIFNKEQLSDFFSTFGRDSSASEGDTRVTMLNSVLLSLYLSELARTRGANFNIEDFNNSASSDFNKALKSFGEDFASGKLPFMTDKKGNNSP